MHTPNPASAPAIRSTSRNVTPRAEQRASRRSRWVPFAVLLAGLLTTGVTSSYIALNARAKDELRFESMVAQTRNNVQARLNTYISLLHGAAGLFAASNNVSRQEFARYVQRLRLREVYPGIQGVGFSVRVRAGQQAALIARAQSEGIREFHVWANPSPATAAARPRNESRNAILYLEPLDRRNRVALGFDMSSDPIRRAAMLRARDTEQAAASGKVLLVQEIEREKQNGFLVYVPVYSQMPKGIAERRRFLEGFVYSPFRAGDLLYGILPRETFARLGLKVYDGKVFPQNLLFDSRTLETAAASGMASPPAFSTTRPLVVGGRTWHLVFQTGPNFEYTLGNALAYWVLAGGVLLSVLFWGLTHAIVRAQENAEERTVELLLSQKALRSSEARARRLIESNVAGVFFSNKEGRIVDANDAFLQLIGYNHSELRQQELTWQAITPPEWTEVDDEAVQALVKDGVTAPYEKEFLRRDGSRVPVLNGVALLKGSQEDTVDLGVAFVLDLSERKRAEAERRELTERFQLMADSAPVLIWMCDPENRGTWFNRPWLEFTGTSLEAQQGFGWLEAIHPDDRSYTAGTCGGAIQQRRPFTMEFRLRRFDQQYRWVLDTGVPLYDSSGAFSGYIGSCVDITEHKKAEEERTLLFDREREAREKAEAARQEAENANRMKDEFLATLSHELRTPLNSILGWAHLLDAGKLGEAEKQQGVDAILRNAKTQAQLIEDLLDMSRIISGKLRLTVYPLQPAPILHAALDAIRPAAAAKGIELHEEIIPGDEFILADAVRLQQIVWNILTNAVKFTSEGGRIELEARRRDENYLIRISDTGAGIAPQFLPHIFDRFRQADSSSTRSHGGLGLGLSIVRHMVERHNGTVRAESEGVGRGATFLVELPLQTLASEEAAITNGTNGATPPPGTQPLRGIKVLIVEDEVDARQLLEFALHRQGAQVQSAADASEGWQRLHDWRPDVLISDIGLPEEDGYAFIERVRASAQTHVAQVPALALTAYARPEDHRHTSAAGFQAHLDKPTDPEALVQTVVQLAQRTANSSPPELPLPSQNFVQ